MLLPFYPVQVIEHDRFFETGWKFVLLFSVWKLTTNRSTKKPTYLVRWTVDGKAFSQSHKTKALADRFRAKLLRAVDRGEPFDTVTGLPDSLRGGRAALSLLELAIKYVDHRWSTASASSGTA